ncbi:MAG: HD domain-containing protein [Candidatus Sericytochromatia bacterium]|nr:HD domain-containing protein [Candidatus Sericytochromatia bacterium]
MSLHFEATIRDPIHGLIPLTACERDLLRTRPLSRMRGVRQMGMAYVIYPGAHHTRFEHMIGAMHTAWLIAGELPIFAHQEKRLLRLAALCHDLGHRPYSHSLEDAARRYNGSPGLDFLGEYLDHENYTRDLLLNDPEIGEVLSRHPDYRHIDRGELAALATGEHPRHDLNLLTHGEIDADRIDYVIRDNYYCGFAHGIDLQSLRNLWALDAQHGLVLSASHTYIAAQLLAARYQLISNVQNNPLSRLGDLLLAEAIREALLHADDSVQQRFRLIANHGQDVDMEHFLRERAPHAWQALADLVAGRPPLELVEVFDFPLLSPAARYALHSLHQRQGSVSRPLQERLQEALARPFLVDIARVSPPVAPLRTQRVGHVPWHGRLTDLPVVNGIVTASLESLAIQVYAAPEHPFRMTETDFSDWVERYRTIDPSLNVSKAEHVVQEFWHNERSRFGLLLALESQVVAQLMERLSVEPARLDILFLSVYAALNRLEDALNEARLYLDGREAVWTLLKHPAVREVWSEFFPGVYRTDEISGELRNDLSYLRQSGLLYATMRLERVRNVFVERHKYGATGWGRRLASQLLEPFEGQDLANRLAQAMDAVFADSVDAYQAYFGLLGDEEPETASRRRDLRRRMPIAVTR